MPVRHIGLLLGLILVIGAHAPSAQAAPRSPDGSSLPGDPAGLILDDRQPAGADLADLRYPPAPAGSHRPRFVAQTGKNCAFASAAMLLDKWTDGRLRPNQLRLRLASRVPSSQGVSFAELSRAVGRVTGVGLRYSPGGGDPLTWDALLARLARGGGAVVGGAYSRLPGHYTRWARDFAAEGARASGHAVYVERYQPGRGGGRVWMMDPLAKSPFYRGEWISARALRHFSWRNARGLVTAAATPEPPPLAGYDFGPAELSAWPVAGDRLEVRLPVEIQPGWTKPPPLSLAATWQLVEAEPDPESFLYLQPLDAAPPAVPELLEPSAEDRAPRPVSSSQATSRGGEQAEATAAPPAKQRAPAGPAELRYADGYLLGSLLAPAQAGRHVLTLELRRGNGKPLDEAGGPSLVPLEVQLYGPLAAQFSLLPPADEPAQGSLSLIEVQVANRGSQDWLKENAATLVAGWETSIGTFTGGSARIELAAGAESVFSVSALVPSRVSEGSLRLELVAARGVPLEPYGAPPVLHWLRFVSEGSVSDGQPATPR
ncbi:MAG TPA: hypothetical protein VMP67_10865 [Candidatus Limnocylindria bacterium]|nr:hypothetical protein [Candidatus Limnocylindria bacterium]